MSKSYFVKRQTYYIVAVNGRTAKAPFPHPTLRDAEVEAERLALTHPGSAVYVYGAYFKISVAADGRIIKSRLKYEKPKPKTAQEITQ